LAEDRETITQLRTRLAALQADLVAARLAEDQARARAANSPASTLEDFFEQEGSKTSSNLRHLPVGLRVMVVDPLPWQSTENNRVRLAQAEMLLWYPLLGLAVFGVLTGRNRLTMIAFPVLVGGGIIVMYALSEGNFGTAYRHRGEVVWAVAVLASIGAERLVDRRMTRSLRPSLPQG